MDTRNHNSYIIEIAKRFLNIILNLGYRNFSLYPVNVCSVAHGLILSDSGTCESGTAIVNEQACAGT